MPLDHQSDPSRLPIASKLPCDDMPHESLHVPFDSSKLAQRADANVFLGLVHFSSRLEKVPELYGIAMTVR